MTEHHQVDILVSPERVQAVEGSLKAGGYHWSSHLVWVDGWARRKFEVHSRDGVGPLTRDDTAAVVRSVGPPGHGVMFFTHERDASYG